MQLALNCRCGSAIALVDVPEDWAIGMATMFAAAHAPTCGFVDCAPGDLETLEGAGPEVP